MIRKSTLFCKIIRIKTSSKSLFLSFMQDFKPELEECPFCHSKGNCHAHATYTRFIVDIIHGKPVYQQLTITRIICDSCFHTHAVLPDTIIPYSQYGIFFILRVLAEYFFHLKTVSDLCSIYGITPSMLYRWRNLFFSRRALWLSVLEQNEQTPLFFLKSLGALDCFSFFVSSFIRLTGFSFLQSHANHTALSQQRCF